MQKLLRKRLVGIGLVVALLAFTVSAMAQIAPNEWTNQTDGASLATRVQTLDVMQGTYTGGAIRLDLGTWGGGYSDPANPYDNLGVMQYTTAAGQATPAWTANGTGAPQNTDIHCIVNDGGYQFVAVSGVPAGETGAQDGLYVYYPGTGFTNVTAGVATVNGSLTWVAIDPSQAGNGIPHVVYFGTHNGGVYRWDGADFLQLGNYPTDPYALNVNQLVVIPASPKLSATVPATPLTIFVATEGYGILKGICSNATGAPIASTDPGTWTWTRVNTGLTDMNVLSIAAFYNTADTNYWNAANNTLEGQNAIYAGTEAGGLFVSYDLGTTWAQVNSTQAINTPVTSILTQYAVSTGNYDLGYLFAGTAGQGVFRLNEVTGHWQPINTAYNDGTTAFDLADMNVYSLAGYYDGNTSANLPVYYLFAGTADDTGAGNVWAIGLTAPNYGGSWFYSDTYTYDSGVDSFFAGMGADSTTTDSPVYQFGASNNPTPWTPVLYDGISGGAPPDGLSVQYRTDADTGDGQIWLTGSPLDCQYGGGMFVADALGNWFDWETSSDTAFTVNPSATINASPAVATVGQLVSFSASLFGVQGTYPDTLSYAWDFGDGGTSTDPSPTHVYTSANSAGWPVTVTITDSSCTSPLTFTATYDMVVNTGLTAAPMVTGQSGFFIWMVSGAQGGVPPYSITYDFGDNTATQTTTWDGTGTEPQVKHQYANYGEYHIVVTVTDSTGKTVTVPVDFIFTGQTSQSVYAFPNTVPAGTNFTLSLNAIGACTTLPCYTVDWGDGTGPQYYGYCASAPQAALPAKVPVSTTYSYDTPGTYTITVTSTDYCSGAQTVSTTQVTVYAPFTALTLAQTSKVCSQYTGTPVTFTLTPTGGLPPYRYVVTWGDGTNTEYSASTADPFTVSHSYAVSGTYDIVAYGTDCQAGVGVAVTNTSNTIAALPIYTALSTVAATASPTSEMVADGGTGTVTLSADTPAGTNFAPGSSWDYYYTAPGDTTPTLITSGTTFPPTATFSGTINYPTPYAPVSYVFSLVLQDGNGCAKNVTTTATTLFYAPLAATAPTWSTGCTTGEVAFNATGDTIVSGGVPPYQYIWHFGDGVNATTTSPTTTHTYSTTGTFNVVLTINDSIGNTTNVNFPVVSIPAISYAVTAQAASVATGTWFQIAASDPTGGTGAGFTFNWNYFVNGAPAVYGTDYTLDTTNSTPQLQIVKFLTPGAWDASVTVADAADATHFYCTKDVTFTVVPGLSCGSFDVTTTSGTIPLPVTLSNNWTGGVAPYTLTVDWGDGTAPTTQTFDTLPAMPVLTQHTYNTPSSTAGYVMTYTLTDSNLTPDSCTGNKVIQVLAPEALTVTTTSSVNGTAGNSGTAPLRVSFGAVPQGGVAPYTFAWDFMSVSSPGTYTSTEQNPVFTYDNVGQYTVSLTVTDSDPSGAKSVTVTLPITVKPVGPTITAAKKVPNPFRIVLFGTNFEPNCTATINGTSVEVKYKNSGKIKLKHCKSLCPKGVPVNIVVTNPDGGVSNTFVFAR